MTTKINVKLLKLLGMKSLNPDGEFCPRPLLTKWLHHFLILPKPAF